MRAWMNERRALLFFAAGRLRPGATIGQAEASLETIAAPLEHEYPEPNAGRSVALRPLAEATIFPGFGDTFVRGGAGLIVQADGFIAEQRSAAVVQPAADRASRDRARQVHLGPGLDGVHRVGLRVGIRTRHRVGSPPELHRMTPRLWTTLSGFLSTVALGEGG
jgi:hypothetical protein